MAVHTEILAGGLFSIRDPALLDTGQLLRAENCVMRPGDPRLWLAPGWGDYDTLLSGSANINSLAVAKFNDDTHMLLALASGYLFTGTIAPATTTNSFAADMATAASVSTAATDLAAVQYGDKYFLFNGVDAPKVLLKDGTVRAMGIQGLQRGLTNPVTATGGAFNGVAGGYYDYWVTEVYKTTAANEGGSVEYPFELESAFLGKPATVQVASATLATTRVALRTPAEKENSAATHWRFYRGGPKQQFDDEVFPVGYQVIDDLAIGDDTYGIDVYDGDSASLDAAAATGITGVTNAWSVTATSSSSTGTAAVASNVSATGDTSFVYLPNTTSTPQFQLTGFSFTNPRDPIGGIEVFVTYTTTSATPFNMSLKVELSLDGSTWTKEQPINMKANTTETVSVGGRGNLWGVLGNASYPDLKPTAATLNNLRVKIYRSIQSSGNGPRVYIDKVLLRAHHSGGIAPENLYNGIVLESNEIQAAMSAGTPPPTASMGTVFEGCLVCNDVSHTNEVRYSQAGEPEYWPEVYGINFETEENDTVTYLGTVNNRLIVGLGTAIARVNYLPTESDTTFKSGVAWEFISRAHGILHQKAATVFTGPDGRQLLAFVSHNGVYATDGYSVVQLSTGLDWYTDIAPGSELPANRVAGLVSDSSDHTLWLYKSNGVAYVYHYLTKVWTGPVYCVPSSGVSLITNPVTVRANLDKIFHFMAAKTTSSPNTHKGKIWMRDSSDCYFGKAYTLMARPNTAHADMVIWTRDMHLGGLGNSCQLHDLVVNGSSAPNNLNTDYPVQVSATLLMRQTNDTDVTAALDQVTSVGAVTRIPVGNANFDSVRVYLTAFNNNTGTAGLQSYCGPVWLNYIQLVHTPGELANDA